MTHKLIKTDNYLLVVDNNKDIEENMWTVKDGKVREVSYLCQDNGCAIIAHLPINAPILEGVDLLPPYSRHQEDGLDKKSFEFVRYIGGTEAQRLAYQDGYIDAREKYKYTEEDMIKAVRMAQEEELVKFTDNEYRHVHSEDEILQSLSQYPTEFECETEPYTVGEMSELPLGTVNQKIKTTTNAQGRVWVGKYK